MYALYFVCYGASLLLTYVAHLSLRGSIHHRDTSTDSSNSSRESQDQQPAEPGTNSSHIGCLWSEWSRWSRCTVTCGSGVRVRHRTALRLPTQNYTQCESEDNIQEKPCSKSFRCYAGNKVYEFPSFSFLFDDEASNTEFSAHSGDVTSSDARGNKPLSEEFHRPTDAPESQQPGSHTYPLPSSSTPSDADHQNVFRVDPSASPPPLKSGTGEWRSRPDSNEDANSNSYCSSFDCSTPESPDGDRRNVWNNFVDDFKEKQWKVDDHSKDGDQTTEQTNEDRREFDGKSDESQRKSESYHQQHRARDDRESDKRGNKHRSWKRQRFVRDKEDQNHDSDVEDKQGGRTDDENIGKGNQGGDPDEDSGDIIDEDDYQDERVDSGEEDGTQDEDNEGDDGSRNRKRNSSIPEDEEQDDKEEMEEGEEDGEKKKKRRKKRKRKLKPRKTEAETPEDVEQYESCQSCDKRDEQIIVCHVSLQ